MRHDPPPQTGPDLWRLQTGALVIIAFAVVLFLLVQARFLLISLVTAIILFSVTSDLINWVGRIRFGALRIPNGVASMLAVLVVAGGLLSATSLLIAQLNEIVVVSLTYLERLPAAVASLFSFLGEEAEAAILASLSTVDASDWLRSLVGQAGALTQGAVLVILFVGFLFAERIWFHTKLLNLLGDPRRVQSVERIIRRIAHKVNYYLLVKTVISGVTGVLIYLLAQTFGLELAVAIGVMTFVLNFIPNVGSIVATLVVGLIAHVEIGSAAVTGVILLISTLVQFVTGNIIDPMLMGRALRLSSFGIVLSLAFWGAIWGIAGMFLSVPIMVMLLVVCSHVPGLRSIAVLLSRQGLPESDDAL